MAEEPQNLRTLYATAESKSKELETSFSTNTAEYQDKLSLTINLYEQCLKQAQSISLFSPNETLEDISTKDLHYLLVNYSIADLLLRRNTADRKAVLEQASAKYAQFLKSLDSYEILSSSDAKLFEQYQEAPSTFSTASTSDPATRRDIKIKRFREEAELKKQLNYLHQNQKTLQEDDGLQRRLELAQLALCTHQTFQSLESIAQELHIISLRPPPQQPSEGLTADARERGGRADGYSERLDMPLSAGLTGPLLDKSGKPLRPFTLLDTRKKLQSEVFRPDHSLPTMTIDEYLEEERRRGGMIDGGGPQSGMQPEPDEDDMDKADAETMKARAWDEYVEANPKGSGNTLNRG